PASASTSAWTWMTTSPSTVDEGAHAYCVDCTSPGSSTPSWFTSSPVRITLPPAAQFAPDGSKSMLTRVATPPHTFEIVVISLVSSTPSPSRSKPTSTVCPPPGQAAGLASTTATSCCSVDGGSHT